MVYAVFVVSSIIILIAMFKSGHIIKSAVLSVLQGLSTLFAVNFIGGFISVHLPFNMFSILTSSIGGLPGVIFLLVYDIIAKIL